MTALLHDEDHSVSGRQELLRFFMACRAEGLEGSPSKRLDQVWHAWLLDEASYRDACRRAVGVDVLHVRSELSLDRYTAAREAVIRRFGSASAAYWPPVESDDEAKLLVADCHDYMDAPPD
jgi:hypothetical protein